MSLNRALTIVAAGFVMMLFSGIVSFYWATYPETTSQVTQRSTQKDNKQPPGTSERDRSESPGDTENLKASNWKAFLNYEGERRRMLGIKKKYSSVNFRTGPGSENQIKVTPESGSLLLPLDRVDDWYRARLNDGTIGWIHRSVVRILQVPKPVSKKFVGNLPPLKESTQELIPDSLSEHNRVRVKKAKVNLRQGPGIQFSKMGRLYKFQEARMMGRRNDWYRVKPPNVTVSWVKENLVEPVWKIRKNQRQSIKIKTTELRMGPKFQFREPELLDDPVKVTLLERQPPWYMVKLDEKTIGWVHENEIIPESQPRTE